ncbi:MAG: GAF domain-containing sensor histidine kinase [Anaerolineae bacterium]|nr:GAF domain-containing sensor histidine kinase [Anaerolineae bacterium]MDW8070823.1 GAF domain-containing sensor histidine kinase [Anaerolineae bacterium]
MIPEQNEQEIEALRREMERLQQRNGNIGEHLSALQVIQHIAHSLVSEGSLEELLETILCSAVRLVRASAGALLLLDQNTGELVFEVIEGGAGPSLKKARMPADKGIVGWVVTHGKPLIVHDVTQDKRFYPRISLEFNFPARSILCVPMMVRGTVIGAIEVLNKTGDAQFTAQDRDLLTILAAQSAVAIENARLYQNLRAEHHRLVTVEAEVRHRLARDIHDGPAQMLASVIMNAYFVREALARGNLEIARREMDEVLSLAEKALRQIRTLLFNLRPVTLEMKGLIPALEIYAQMLQQNERFAVVLQVESEIARLNREAESTIFAVIQEAISNVRKHAEARQAIIRLAVTEDGYLEVSVKDDGVGFNPNTISQTCAERGSLGILTMQERALSLQGSLSIHSAPGAGTEVRLRLPLAPNLANATE